MRKAKSIPLWMRRPEDYPSLANSFRSLKSHLNLLKESKGLKVFLLTGSDREIGVSTIAFNLALMMSWDFVDQRILLVETNLDNPSIHVSFEKSPEPGLMDYLLKEFTLSQVVQESFMKNLDLVTIGQTTQRVTSPFDLKKFTEFAHSIRESYDFVILDSTPALRSSNTQIISRKADGVVIVAEANRTRYEAVEELKNQLERNSNLVGAVLNKRRFFIPQVLYRNV